MHKLISDSPPPPPLAPAVPPPPPPTAPSRRGMWGVLLLRGISAAAPAALVAR